MKQSNSEESEINWGKYKRKAKVEVKIQQKTKGATQWV